MPKKLSYKSAGVNYEALDPFKRKAAAAALETAENIQRFGCAVVEESYGESAFLIEFPDFYLAHVEEGLGTKNLIAQAMNLLTGKTYYESIAQDTVAMIVNDMVTSGAMPVSVAMHIASGMSDWFYNEKRCDDLISGWKKACALARCAWGGGETPTLKGIVMPQSVVLNGSAVGIIRPKERRIRGDIQHGDAIVLFESSGVHSNGLTLARSIAEKLPSGYQEKLSDGRIYGEALLSPTVIYVPIIEECLCENIGIHSAVHITGHGWKKLMRHPGQFEYCIEKIPDANTIFAFMQERGPVDDREAYATFNMGAGFALYIPECFVRHVIHISRRHGVAAFHAGYVRHSPDEKKVLIRPLGLEYRGSELNI